MDANSTDIFTSEGEGKMDIGVWLQIFGYSSLGIIVVIIVVCNMLRDKKFCILFCERCKKRRYASSCCTRSSKDSLIQTQDLKAHYYENLAHDYFRVEIEMLNKKSALQKVVANTLVIDMTDGMKVDTAADPTRVFYTDNAEYLHCSGDHSLDIARLHEFSPDLIINFKNSFNRFGLRLPQRSESSYSVDERDFTVREELIESICLLDYSILTIEDVKRGDSADVDLCAFTIPLWGNHKLPDYYSILLVHDVIRGIKTGKTDGAPIKIFIQSSESLYNSVVTVLESLHLMDREQCVKPLSIINQFKRSKELSLTPEDHRWIYHTLMLCHEEPVCVESLSSFATQHPSKLLTEQFYKSQIHRFKLVVPKLDPKLCVAGIRCENRKSNRNCDVLALDTETPLFGNKGSPTKHNYINATYIKGYSSDRQLIVTEWPKKNTAPIFWKLVQESEIRRIFVIGHCKTARVPKRGRYMSVNRLKLAYALQEAKYMTFWPCGETGNPQSEEYNRLTVTHMGAVDDNPIVQKYKLKIQKDSQTCSEEAKKLCHCDLYHIPEWPERADDIDDLLLDSLITAVNAARQQENERECRVCVVSVDGYSGCGVILTLWSIIEELHALDENFELFNTIRLLKLNRPSLMNSIVDMALVYRLILRMHHKSLLNVAPKKQ